MKRITSLVILLALLLAAAALAAAAEKKPPVDPAAEDLALQPPPVITAPGAEYADNARRWQGIPGIERAAGGRLWATWYSGGTGEGPENYVLLVTSADDGRTWSAPVLVVDPTNPVRAFDPALWIDPAGRLWLFWAQSYGQFDGRGGVWAVVTETPNAERPTWSAPRRLCNGVMMNKPVVLSTGEWVLPAAVWSHSAKDKHTELAAEKFSNAVVSTDQGKTWSRRGGADVPERTFDEHHIVERRDGSLWVLVRTKYGIGESVSTDGGRTWTPGKPTALPHTSSRFFVRRLASGNLLMVKHSPPEGVKMGRSFLTASLSTDDGRSWQGGLALDARAGVSYPDAVQAKDGRIYIIYDFSRSKERQILMAVITEADVLAGRVTTEGSRMQVQVNQATGELPKK